MMSTGDSRGSQNSGSTVTSRSPGSGDALLVVDLQKDFLPGGALAVSQADEIVPVVNRYIELFVARSLPVFVSRDCHPADHSSFREQGGLWPVHCVAESPGAAFDEWLRLPPDARIISKGTRQDSEGYSVFDGTDFDSQLEEFGVQRLFVGGVAAEFCVRVTVNEALDRGYQAVLLTDAIRALNAEPGDGDRALADMVERGARAFFWENLSDSDQA